MISTGEPWAARLAKAVQEPQPGHELEHLDELLGWLCRVDARSSAAIDEAIREIGMSDQAARQGALELLDNYLFENDPTSAHSVLGLSTSPQLTIAEVRDRYRRLIKVFHPDRNPGREQWATGRAEQINSAYETLHTAINKTKAVNNRLNNASARPSAGGPTTTPPPSVVAAQRYVSKRTPLLRTPAVSVLILLCCAALTYAIIAHVVLG